MKYVNLSRAVLGICYILAFLILWPTLSFGYLLSFIFSFFIIDGILLFFVSRFKNDLKGIRITFMLVGIISFIVGYSIAIFDVIWYPLLFIFAFRIFSDSLIFFRVYYFLKKQGINSLIFAFFGLIFVLYSFIVCSLTTPVSPYILYYYPHYTHLFPVIKNVFFVYLILLSLSQLISYSFLNRLEKRYNFNE